MAVAVGDLVRIRVGTPQEERPPAELRVRRADAGVQNENIDALTLCSGRHVVPVKREQALVNAVEAPRANGARLS